MKSGAIAGMTSSHATASRMEHALQWTDAKTKMNLWMDFFAVLSKGYYLGIKPELIYTDYTMYQNAMLSVFPAAIILLVTALISLRVLIITVMSHM